jgi:2-(1,2-epoxy-1,2-dihydrophenyl)acetyl-CoA isomerase
MTEAPVFTTVDGACAVVTLNRPDRLNAMTSALLESLLAEIEGLVERNDVEVIVLTGAGRAFCSGGDLAEGLDEINGPPPLASQTGRLRRFMRISQLLHSAPQVTIAAVNGACAGAGLSLALACDLRIAASTARFSTAFIGAGVSGDFGGIWFATRLLGAARARELFILSERIDAKRMAELGVVHLVSPAETFSGDTLALSRTLAARAPKALRAMKRNLVDAEELDLATYLDREAVRHARTVVSPDAAEAAAAFIERRPPVFGATLTAAASN